VNQQVFDLPRSNRLWFAVKTQPRREQLAKLHLERQGYLTFLPRMRTPAARRLSKGDYLTPFFPSYLFVNLDVEQDAWRPINSTIGVLQIVKFGISPTPLPRGLVEELQLASDECGVLGFRDDLKRGDTVTLVGGAFDSLKGIFEAQTDEQRVQVLLTMMSRQVRITVKRSEVMKASK